MSFNNCNDNYVLLRPSIDTPVKQTLTSTWLLVHHYNNTGFFHKYFMGSNREIYMHLGIRDLGTQNICEIYRDFTAYLNIPNLKHFSK